MSIAHVYGLSFWSNLLEWASLVSEVQTMRVGDVSTLGSEHQGERWNGRQE